MRGDFDKSRTKKPPLLGEVAAVRLTEGFKKISIFLILSLNLNAFEYSIRGR